MKDTRVRDNEDLRDLILEARRSVVRGIYAFPPTAADDALQNAVDHLSDAIDILDGRKNDPKND